MGRTYDLGKTVDGPGVQPFTLIRRVLHLQSGFYVLDRPRDEGYGPAGHDAGEGVAHDGEFLLGLGGETRGVEEVVVEDAAVDAERAEHAANTSGYRSSFVFGVGCIHRVHEHPSHERRRGPLVYPLYALISQRLCETVYGTAEVRGVGGLESDFDGVEWVPHWEYESASYLLHT